VLEVGFLFIGSSPNSLIRISIKSVKGPKEKEDCAASIGGSASLLKNPAGVPQIAAEA
jgi:hypothetical protein